MAQSMSLLLYCTLNEWDEAKRSFEQVNECGRAAFLAQWGHVGNDQRYIQIVEQTILRRCTWTSTTGERQLIRSTTPAFTRSFGVIGRVACSYLSIIDAKIQLSYLKLLYYSQQGIFFVPHLKPNNFLVCMVTPWPGLQSRRRWTREQD